MVYKVSEMICCKNGVMSIDPLMYKTREETRDCSHNHICLEGQREHLCRVVAEYGNKVLFLQDSGTPKKSCPYFHTFGDDGICTCPVRYRLYVEYGV